ncbi:MAG: nucleotide exchange factor GrpE [Candidatus Wildermuthbacteria bacterium RIFCSPHIGHO2_12_FULL_45_9]|uniref:Protein GrpE n=1 Tax=Candidatus Wildermuthbacteria bacterium RIFCSPHIGHO2_02_FULL_45_25 TaxID=1802450 RepID=A0A1G2R288_9BACT|nr:MAG: nucleotide exchange factor GrpE [Candidatus Wildermuthbacteria bacterium RIFCSPHIGHO2_01_FULL_45_20]OHA66985.1 MAG: nucleotide exchange factor GrpE [Candidatus Wildermuthbacteria bacterium RIFCSPHIGHO2_02_FULL_45_25]OHA71327.1 MAG: nucleotide exchange factor GrpE [Candidatus Wildermuthbacteria bacterium RIFCSPHIGHO2_12_FULL_45_9]
MEEHKKEHDSSCAWDLGEHQEFQKRLEQCEKEKEEYLNGWKRVKADFLNYQKEQRERMEMTIEYVKEKMILDMLPILDNLERAEKQISPADRENQIWKGFSQIALQMREFFKGQGMEAMGTTGERFDPNLHEAVGEVEGRESGTIVEEIEKGYKRNGRLVRPAKVKIGANKND